jgi:hypothetical protein
MDRSVPVSAFTFFSRDRSVWIALRCDINCCRQSSTVSFKRTSSLRYCWTCGVDLSAAKRGSDVSMLVLSSKATAFFIHSAVAAGGPSCPRKTIISSSSRFNLFEQLSNSSKMSISLERNSHILAGVHRAGGSFWRRGSSAYTFERNFALHLLPRFFNP